MKTLSVERFPILMFILTKQLNNTIPTGGYYEKVPAYDYYFIHSCNRIG